MWYVTIDAVSVKEIDNICNITKRNVWNNARFDSKQEAIEFAGWCKEIAPLAEICVEE